jgi:hypothetical protein
MRLISKTSNVVRNITRVLPISAFEPDDAAAGQMLQSVTIDDFKRLAFNQPPTELEPIGKIFFIKMSQPILLAVLSGFKPLLELSTVPKSLALSSLAYICLVSEQNALF